MARQQLHKPMPRPAFLDHLGEVPCQGEAHIFALAGDAAERWAIAYAKIVCRGCPVKKDCREYALSHREQWGIWGGLTEDARKAIIAKRNKELKDAG